MLTRRCTRYAFVPFLLLATSLAACDSAEPGEPVEPVALAPLIEYRIEGFGDFPADHANIIWYTDAVGDTVKTGYHQTRWSTQFRIDTLNHQGTNLYLYTVVQGRSTEIGTRAAIYVDGELVNEQVRDGWQSSSQGTSTLYAIAEAPGQ